MPPTKMTIKKRAPSASWLDIVWKAVHQLSVVYPGRDHFHYYQDICRYIETHWERLAQGKDRTSTWTNTVSSTITTHKRIFKPGPDQGFWGLRQHPHDDTPMEILDEIRQQLGEEAPIPVPVQPVSQQQNRRKRKTGWGDKNKKRQRVFHAPVEQDEDSEESELSFDSTDSEAREVHATQQPLLPPIYPGLKEEEEEFVDIEGVSEEDVMSSPDHGFYLPSSPEPSSNSNWSPSDDACLLVSDSGLFVENCPVPGEEWFQSLFA
jgi:hypothetical protein